jgi:ASC-1-like (ASCH) protein
MKYQMDLSEFSYNKIKAGRRIDMRLLDKKRQALKIGDTIEYSNINKPGERMECQLLGMAIFDNFSNLVDCLTPQMLGYDNKEEVILRLNRAYPLDIQKEFNVTALFIKDITPLPRELYRGELVR